MEIAVAYCRVSTKNQNEALQDHQEQWGEIFEKVGYVFANCGVFYKKDGYRETKEGLYVDEGISAKEYKKHRKAFLQMIEDAKKGKFKQIFVEDVTRFARSVEDGMKVIKDFREYGVNVHFRKEGLDSIEPANDMIFGVLFSVAENEIRTDSNRFKWKQERLAKVGKWSAPAPYGYNVKKAILSINDKEIHKADYIFYLYTEKLLGMRSIANYLNNVKKWRTRKGQLWKASEIRYILNNPIYKGDIVNHKTESVDITRGTTRKVPEKDYIVVHNEKLRIIDDKTWRKKDRILEQRNKKFKNREGYSSKHLLSTLLYCEQCGSTYIRVKKNKTNDKNKNKIDRGYEWTCLGHNHYGDIKCKGRYGINEEDLIKFIIKELKKEKDRDNTIYLNLYLKKKREEIAKIDIKKLQEEKEEMQRQIFEVRADKNNKLISQDTYEEQLKAINKRLDEIRVIKNKYDNIKIDIINAEERFKQRIELLNNLDFDRMDNSDLKQIFNKIIIRGEYDNGYKNIYIHFSYNFLDDIKTELARDLDDIEHSTILHFYQFQRQKIRKSTNTRYFENK